MDDLVELFRTTWWAADRDRATVAALLDGSDVVCGCVHARSGKLQAFCRVLTDARTIALVLDVVVTPALRGTGVGRDMLERLLQTPPVCDVLSVELVCQPETVPFYERLGFTTDVGRSLLMRRSANPTFVP